MAGEGVSAIGDAIAITVLPLLVLQLTGSGLAMGLLGALQVLPDLLVGVFAGVVADRTDRRRLMIAANVGRTALFLLVPLSVLIEGPTLAIVMIVAAPASTLRTFYLASHAAAIAAIAGRERLASATSANEVVYSLGFVIGPAVAGLLVAALGAGLAVTSIAVAYAATAVAVTLIRTDLRPPPAPQRIDLLAEARAGMDYIRRHPALRAVILFWSAIRIVTAGIFTALTVHVTRDIGRSEAELGLLFATYGLGTVGAALLVHRVRSAPARMLMLSGCFLQAIAITVAGLSGSAPILAILAFAAGLGGSTILISYLTIRTASSPDTMLGRIGATARVLSFGMQPIGMVATGAMIDVSNGSTTLVAMGVLVAVIGVVAIRARGLRAASFRSAVVEAPTASTPLEPAAGSSVPGDRPVGR
jgi:predicted MFS family arabinose efflux permease